jgi:hypothetical protein
VPAPGQYVLTVIYAAANQRLVIEPIVVAEDDIADLDLTFLLQLTVAGRVLNKGAEGVTKSRGVAGTSRWASGDGDRKWAAAVDAKGDCHEPSPGRVLLPRLAAHQAESNQSKQATRMPVVELSAPDHPHRRSH